MRRTNSKPFPLEVVRALREKPNLIERANIALARGDFPEELRVPLKSLLDRAGTLTPTWFVLRLKSLLNSATELVRARAEAERKKRQDHLAAVKRREVLKKKLEQMELTAGDAQDVEIMMSMFERHLKCQKDKAIPRSEKDMVMTPGEFVQFTERYLRLPYLLQQAAPSTQPQAPTLAKSAS